MTLLIPRPDAGPATPRPRVVKAKQLAAHHHAADLVGALVDLGDLGVAHHALHREVTGEAITPKQLNRVNGDLHRDVGGEGLGTGSHQAQSLPALGDPALRVGRGGVDHQPGGVDLHLHIGKHELGVLEAAWLPERCAP